MINKRQTLSICTVNFHHERAHNVERQSETIKNLSKLKSKQIEHVIVTKDRIRCINLSNVTEHEIPRELQSITSLSMRRNLGIDLSKGDYIWLMDDDVIINEQLLSNLIEAINLFKPEGILVLNSLNIDKNNDPEADYNSLSNKGNNANTIFELKYSYSKTIKLLRCRSIELIFNKRFFHGSKFDETRGIGVNQKIGAETLFAFSKGIPPVSVFVSEPIASHIGKSSGGNMTFARLHNSGHIQTIFHSLFPGIFAFTLEKIYFLLKRIQLWKRG